MGAMKLDTSAAIAIPAAPESGVRVAVDDVPDEPTEPAGSGNETLSDILDVLKPRQRAELIELYERLWRMHDQITGKAPEHTFAEIAGVLGVTRQRAEQIAEDALAAFKSRWDRLKEDPTRRVWHLSLWSQRRDRRVRKEERAVAREAAKVAEQTSFGWVKP